LLACLGALVLLGTLPLTWYAPVAGKGALAPPPQSALEVFAWVDLLLVLLALPALALPVVHRARTPVFVFACLMTAVVGYRLIDPPANEAFVTVRPAAYLGLLATAGIAVGAALTLPEVRAWARGSFGPWTRAPLTSRGAGLLAAGALALLALYLIPRISFIDRAPYFFDEGYFGYLANRAATDLDDLFITFTIGREPLGFWMAIPFIKSGFGPLDAVRLVSLVCGMGTVAVTGLLARRLFGTAAGVVAAVICTVLPFFVVHDGIGITEPLLILVFVLSLYLQVELARRPRLGVAGLLAVVFAAAVLTKQSAAPALVLLPFSLLCFDWSPERRGERLRRWLAGVGIAVAGALCGWLVLRFSGSYEVLTSSRNSQFYPVRTLREAVAQPGVGWHTAWPVYGPAFSGYVSVPLLAAAAAGAGLGLARLGERRRTALLLVWILVPFTIAVLFTNLPFPRHVLYLVPPAIVLMGHALASAAALVRRRLAPRPAMAVVAVAAVLLVLPALLLDGRILSDPATAAYPSKDSEQYVTGTGAGSIWPAVTDAVQRRAKGRQVVILLPSAQKAVLQFMLGSDSRYALVKGESPLAPRAQFAVYDQNTGPLVNQSAHLIAQRRGFVPIARFERPRHGAVVTLWAPPARRPPYVLERGRIRSATGETLRIVPGAVGGQVQRAQLRGPNARLGGWAASLRWHRAARYVLLFSGGRFVAAVPPTVARKDLRRRTGIVALQRSGFVAQVPRDRLGPRRGAPRLEVFAVDGNVASRLPFRCAPRPAFGC
jgi:hypothetical protein